MALTRSSKLSDLYPFTVYATTLGGHRFAVMSCPTLQVAEVARKRHMLSHPSDVVTIVDNSADADDAADLERSANGPGLPAWRRADWQEYMHEPTAEDHHPSDL